MRRIDYTVSGDLKNPPPPESLTTKNPNQNQIYVNQYKGFRNRPSIIYKKVVVKLHKLPTKQYDKPHKKNFQMLKNNINNRHSFNRQLIDEKEFFYNKNHPKRMIVHYAVPQRRMSDPIGVFKDLESFIWNYENAVTVPNIY